MNPTNSKPVNKTAALVVSKGFSFDFSTNHHHDSDMPLPTRRPKRIELANPNFADLTGLQYGRLTVIGLSRDCLGRWVVRCSCGTYSVRKTKVVKKQSADDMCEKCRTLEQRKRNYRYEKTGRN